MPPTERRKLRAELVREEAAELVEALESGLLVPTIDAMCDLIVVTLGTAIECNVDLNPFWAEVHASNMAKRGGPTREDGKKLKPEGWQPPDLNGVLQTGRGRYS
jgi:predicted HAD superfamily Cof-like phosphohydrolase